MESSKKIWWKMFAVRTLRTFSSNVQCFPLDSEIRVSKASLIFYSVAVINYVLKDKAKQLFNVKLWSFRPQLCTLSLWVRALKRHVLHWLVLMEVNFGDLMSLPQEVILHKKTKQLFFFFILHLPRAISHFWCKTMVYVNCHHHDSQCSRFWA